MAEYTETKYPEWNEFSPGAVRKAPCIVCGVVSPWYPTGWHYIYRSIRGGPRKGAPKVKTERMCPECWGKRG